MGLEPHTFCYPGRYPKPVMLEETPNSHLASEFIITNANTTSTFRLIFLELCSNLYDLPANAIKAIHDLII
jgi:hypothetical protein